MKNGLTLLICLMLLFAAGCSSNTAPPAAAATEPSNDATSVKIDVDLTEFSKTMMIAMIDSIYTTPDEYIGKTIKMGGKYSSVYYSDINQRFHYVLFSDEESCCSYGFIFEYDGAYPDDYPEEDADIAVSGIFGSGEALGQKYHYLAVDDDDIVILN